MQLVEKSNSSAPKNDSPEGVLDREILKLSGLDAEAMSDLSGMFGVWKEADHCDKDIG